MKKILFALALSFGMVRGAEAQITVPNTLVAGTTITASGLNTNFSTIANHALDRLSGGNISGNITMDPGITLDGVDVGVQACITCNPTHAKLTLTDTSATALTVGGGLTIGTGTVVLVNTAGKIPAINSTTFASLSGTNLTGVALLATPNVFATRNDFLTYTENKTAPSISAGVLTVDLSLGTHFAVPLTANITTLTISNPNASGKAGSFTLAFTADGTLRTISWPASVKWPAGTAPTLTSTNAKVDVFTFISYDGGTTWYGLVVGQNF